MPAFKGRYKTSLIGTIRTLLSGLSGYDTMALELIQNADDAKATNMSFDIQDKCLKVSNSAVFNYCGNIEEEKCTNEPNGKKCDFHSVLDVANGHKSKHSENIGRFGIGFISTYQITDRPTIISNGLSVKLIPENDEYVSNIVKTKETVFELPWAKDENSDLRIELGQGTIDNNKIDRLFLDCEAVLNKSLLFLKHLRTIELKRNGVSKLIVIIERKTESKDKEKKEEIENVTLSFKPQNKKEKWLIFKSEINKLELEQAYKDYPMLKADDRKKEIQIATKIDKYPIKKGLLYAYLPTQQASQLPLHISADFYPDMSRKSIILSGQQKEQIWNTLLIKNASEVIADKLETLSKYVDHNKLFSIIVDAYISNNNIIDEDSPFGYYWNAIFDKIEKGAELIYSSKGHYHAGNKIVYDIGLGSKKHVNKKSIDTLYKAGGVLVNKDLLSLSNDSIDVLNALNISQLDIEKFSDIIRQSDIYSSEKDKNPRKEKDLKDTYKPLWAYANYLLNDSENNSSIDNLNFILNTNMQALSVQNVYRAPSFIVNSKLCEMLSANFFAHDELKKYTNIYERIDLFQLNYLIKHFENKSLGSSNLPKKLIDLKAFYEMITQLSVHKNESELLYKRLKNLPIWRTNQGLNTLQGILLPGDFEDPTGVAPYLHPKSLSKPIQNFLERKLGVQRQTIEAYIEFILPKYFSEEGPQEIEMYQKLMAVFADHKKLLKDENTVELLSETPLIPTKIGDWKSPKEVYFYDKKLAQLIGNNKELWVDEKKLTNKNTVRKFVKELGILSKPLPKHLTGHLIELSEKNLPTKEVVNKSSLIFSKLCDIYDSDDEIHYEIGELLDELSYEKCFPVIGDYKNWHDNDDLYSSIKHKSIKYSNAKLIAYKIDSKLDICDELLQMAGISQIHLDHVIEHINYCIDNNYKIASEILEAVNSHYKKLPPTLDNDYPIYKKLKELYNLPFIYNSEIKKCIRPNQLFFKKEVFNKYIFIVSTELDKYKSLLKTVGVKDYPSVDDYINIVIHDLIDKDTDKTTYISCINYISEHINEADQDLLDQLAAENSILNHFGDYNFIDSILIDDSEWIKGYFSRENEELKWLTSLDIDWSVFESLGLNKLSKSATFKLSYYSGEKSSENDILQTIQDRKELFVRALDKKPKSTIKRLLSCITNLKVVSYDSIKVKAIIESYHLKFSSTEISEKSYFSVTDNELILSRPTSKLTYISILKPILHSLTPDSDDDEFRHLQATFDAICMRNVTEAESYLDELNFKKNEDIDIEEDSPEEYKYSDSEAYDAEPSEEEYHNNNENNEDFADDEPSIDSFDNQEIQPGYKQDSVYDRNEDYDNKEPDYDNKEPDYDNKEPDYDINSSPIRKPRGKVNKKPNNFNQQKFKSYTYTSNKLTDSSNVEKSNNDINLEIENISRAIVVDHEIKSGRQVKEMDQTNPGFDIISCDKDTGEILRYIEVKGTISKWDKKGVSVSYTQFSNAQEEGEKAWLYIVDEVYGKSPNLYRIQDFAIRTNSFMYDSGWTNIVEEEDEFANYGVGVVIDLDKFGRGVIKNIDRSSLIPKLEIYFEDFEKTFKKVLNTTTMKIIKEND